MAKRKRKLFESEEDRKAQVRNRREMMRKDKAVRGLERVKKEMLDEIYKDPGLREKHKEIKKDCDALVKIIERMTPEAAMYYIANSKRIPFVALPEIPSRKYEYAYKMLKMGRINIVNSVFIKLDNITDVSRVGASDNVLRIRTSAGVDYLRKEDCPDKFDAVKMLFGIDTDESLATVQ